MAHTDRDLADDTRPAPPPGGFPALENKIRLSGILSNLITMFVLAAGYGCYDTSSGFSRVLATTIIFFISIPIVGFLFRYAVRRLTTTWKKVLDNGFESDEQAPAVVRDIIETPWGLGLTIAFVWMTVGPIAFFAAERVTAGAQHTYLELLLLQLIAIPPIFLLSVIRLDMTFKPYVAALIPESLLSKTRSPFMITFRKRMITSVYLLGPYLLCVFAGLIYLRVSQSATVQDAVGGVVPLIMYFLFLSFAAAALVTWYFQNSVEKPLSSILTALQSPDAQLTAESVDEFGIASGLLKERKKLEQAKQEFVALVSHELRSPLMSMQGFLSILSKGGYGDVSETVLKKADLAERNASRLVKLINDLLDAEKLQAGKFECTPHKTSSESIVERAVQSVKDLADANNVSLQINCRPTEMYADEDRMVQVMVNLISNAIKYSEGKPVVVTAESSGDGIEFGVKDQGKGIPENQRSAIFERFKQISADNKGKNRGTGLGLPIAKALVEEHGGAIGVDTKAGSGSYFWVRLPQRQEKLDGDK
jgi:signal transduction histidine kinase